MLLMNWLLSFKQPAHQGWGHEEAMFVAVCARTQEKVSNFQDESSAFFKVYHNCANNNLNLTGLRAVFFSKIDSGMQLLCIEYVWHLVYLYEAFLSHWYFIRMMLILFQVVLFEYNHIVLKMCLWPLIYNGGPAVLLSTKPQWFWTSEVNKSCKLQNVVATSKTA